MGCFSWLTADTKESVLIDNDRTSYLLQPDGKPPIKEENYSGSGNFGNKNAYVWVAENNLPEHIVKTLSENELFTAGVNIALGRFYKDANTGKTIMIFSRGLAEGIEPRPDEFFPGRYDQAIPGYDGKTANDLIAEGRFIEQTFNCRNPIKISFNENADYNSLPASEDCPNQGFMVDDEDE